MRIKNITLKACKRKNCLYCMIVFVSQIIKYYLKPNIPFVILFLLDAAVALCGIYIVCSFSKYICSNSLFKVVVSFLNYIGQNSLIIMAVHNPARDFILGILIWGITGTFYSGHGIRFINTIGSLILCLPFVEFVNQYMPQVLGKTGVKI